MAFTLKMEELVLGFMKRSVPVYQTLDDYVGEISRKASPNVELKNIGTLFAYFGGLLMFVSLVNTFQLKLLQIINRKLVILAHFLNFCSKN
jgi:hypothetical protein